MTVLSSDFETFTLLRYEMFFHDARGAWGRGGSYVACGFKVSFRTQASNLTAALDALDVDRRALEICCNPRPVLVCPQQQTTVHVSSRQMYLCFSLQTNTDIDGDNVCMNKNTKAEYRTVLLPTSVVSCCFKYPYLFGIFLCYLFYMLLFSECSNSK